MLKLEQLDATSRTKSLVLLSHTSSVLSHVIKSYEPAPSIPASNNLYVK